MLIRPATLDDVPAIVRLLASDRIGGPPEDVSHPLPAAYRDAFARIDGDPDNHLVVGVDEDGTVIATLQLTFIPYLAFHGSWRAQIEAVRVESSRRGGGLGTELVTWAVETARARGCRLVQLTSNRARADAHRFYERLGFAASHTGFKLDLTRRPDAP